MMLDARALVALFRKEPGFETIVESLALDESPKVSATALAEAAILMAATGDSLTDFSLQILVDRLGLIVVPFTDTHWKEAVREYVRAKENGERPTFGQCLSLAVAKRLGSTLVSTPGSREVR